MAEQRSSMTINGESATVEAGKTATPTFVLNASKEASSVRTDIDHRLSNLEHSATELQGWRLRLVLLAIGLGIFLVQLETTIVSTSLISITNDLSGLQDVSWVVTAYLITYSACLTILSKLSDIFGRWPLFTISFASYIGFSLGCGFSQTMPALIILRALQGIGAGGIYALSYVILPEVLPPHLYSAYAAYVGAVAAVASLLGPLLGGAISSASTSSWRWVFWLNGPVGVVATFFLLLGLPKQFPFHANPIQPQSIRQKLQRLDYLGAMMLLGACVLLTTGLEEGGTRYAWSSAVPLTAVIVSLALWICFVLWSKALSHRQTLKEAIFPWSVMLNRFAMGALISTFFSGAVFIALAISLPQRFQIIHGSSPFLSGVYILPLTISLPLGAVVTGVLLTRLRIPPLYILLGSAVLQLLGVAIVGGQTVRNGIPAAIYGLQILIGIGLGLNLTTSILLVPMSVSKEHQAIGMGSIGQFRNLGSSVCLAIFANVLNSTAKNRLATVLNPQQLDAFLQYPESISMLPLQIQDQVKDAYESGYQLQLRVLLAFSCGVVLATGLIFEKRPRHQDEKGELA